MPHVNFTRFWIVASTIPRSVWTAVTLIAFLGAITFVTRAWTRTVGSLGIDPAADVAVRRDIALGLCCVFTAIAVTFVAAIADRLSVVWLIPAPVLLFVLVALIGSSAQPQPVLPARSATGEVQPVGTELPQRCARSTWLLDLPSRNGRFTHPEWASVLVRPLLLYPQGGN